MAVVVIGVDPAKRSHAVEVLDEREPAGVRCRSATTATATGIWSGWRGGGRRGCGRWRALPGWGCSWRNGWLPTANRCLDVPSMLSTRARMFDAGHGRKNDPGDARTVAVVAMRTTGLHQVVPDDEMVALRLMRVKRRRDLVRSRTQTVNHLHQVLMELIAAGAKRNLTAKKAKTLVATVRPPRRRRASPPAGRGRQPDRGPGRVGPQTQRDGQATQGRRSPRPGQP